MCKVISSKKSIYFFTDNAPYFTNVNLILNNIMNVISLISEINISFDPSDVYTCFFPIE